jgi:hypothetical protein
MGIFKSGRQNSARFHIDQGGKLDKRLFNNRELKGKGLLFFLYFKGAFDAPIIGT